MSDLPRRTATALVYGAVVLVAVLAPALVFWGVLLVVAVLGGRELAALSAGRAQVALGVVFVAGLIALGIFKEIGPLAARHAIAHDQPVWIFFAVVPTWAGDVVAYLVGSAIGHRPLAPRISPGKTWEGSIAGVLAAALAAVGVATLFGLARHPTLELALLVGPVGLAGDLLESYVKRRSGVKDSGTLLPGHGGILDRLDSVTAVAAFTLVVGVAWSLPYIGAEGGIGEWF